MKRMFLTTFVCLAVLSASGAGAAGAPRPAAPKAPPSSRPTNFRISFVLRLQDMQSAGNFVVQDGAQANYTRGGDAPFEVKTEKGTGLEFKKYGTIVNCLPVSAPGGKSVAADCQFELSGPGRPETTFQVKPPMTFQLQTSFVAEIGKTTVLVDEPDRRLEVRIDEAKP